MHDALVRAGYFLTDKVISLSEVKKMVDELVKDGMIGRTDETGIVATISQVIIDWDQELATLTIKLDPELADMPPLEDVFDNDLGIIIPNSFTRFVITIPQPFTYENNKVVP